MKKLTNKQRCRKCIHKKVCKYFGVYDGLDGFAGYKCKDYKPREEKKGKSDEQN